MNIKYPNLILSLICTVVFTATSKTYAFYGRHTAKTVLTFEAQIEVPVKGLNSVKQLKLGEMREKVIPFVDLQLQHLMGIFQSSTFYKEVGASGVLGLVNYKGIKFLKVEKTLLANRVLITYEYTGDALFEKDLFSGPGTSIEIPIKLPLVVDIKDTPTDPRRIYQVSFNSKKGMNPCTDEHYNTEGDFWYFWDPDQKGCPLKSDNISVVRTVGKAIRIDKSNDTYPEYDKLFKSKYNDGALDIAVFIGYVEEDENAYLVDPAYDSFKYLQSEFVDRGFKLTSKKDAFKSVSGKIKPGVSFERVFEKNVTPESGSGLPEAAVRIKVLLTNTAMDSDDQTFHNSFRKAVKEAEIVVYDGHSGLGANLDVNNISDLVMPKDKYQIFFLNGCSSYTYYNYMYTAKKGGTKNFDLLAAGLQTYTDATGPNIVAFLNYIIDGKPRGYEKTVQNIEASNGSSNGTFLVNVSGDEDNVWKPKN